MRTSRCTAKELCEQLVSDNNMLARKMSDLLALRKLVADAGSHSSRPIASLMELRAAELVEGQIWPHLDRFYQSAERPL